MSDVNEDIMLKNAIFADLFFAQAWKNINNIYVAIKKLQSCEIGQLQILTIKLKPSHKVKAAGKKWTSFKPSGKNL